VSFLQLNACFTLDLDKRAYLAATTRNTTLIHDFFFSELVMSEGAPFKCIHLDTLKEVSF
jgi:hypothetical protein